MVPTAWVGKALRRVGFSLPVIAIIDAKIGCMAASVLIVDDDPSFRELAARVLRAAGLRVVSQADSVAAAMPAARAAKPDAALVDVMLPDGDGVALARELAALPWGPRVLVTSSSPDAAGQEEIGRSGAVGFVPKHELPNAPLERLLGGA